MLASGEEVPCEVLVFSLRVDHVANKWKERHERERRRVSQAAAMMRMVDEPDLCQVVAYSCADIERFTR